MNKEILDIKSKQELAELLLEAVTLLKETIPGIVLTGAPSNKDKLLSRIKEFVEQFE